MGKKTEFAKAVVRKSVPIAKDVAKVTWEVVKFIGVVARAITQITK